MVKKLEHLQVEKYSPNKVSDIEYEFDGSKAVDGSLATRFDAGVGAETAWILVDLGRNYEFSQCETIFEFTNKTYKYKIEYISSEEAGNIDEAVNAKEWKVFCHKTEQGTKMSPVVDKNKATGRYLRLTVVGMEGVPERSAPKDENAVNAISIVSFKVM